MTRFEVTSFGEAMLRLSTPAGARLETARQLDIHPAGAESNVLAALARLERRCGWVSSLPDNALGRVVTNQLRQAGVDVSAVVWAGQGRMGTYFVEFAGPPRAIEVIYDRAGSCVTFLRPEQIDWEYLLDTRLLHLTGITPALSAGCQAIVAEAIGRARQQGVAVSFDVNYRSKLWPAGAAAAALLPLMQEVELLLCSRRDACALFGCEGSAEVIVEQLAAQTRARQIVVTLAEEGAIGWDGGKYYHRQAARPVQIVDRIGAGDALAAGVLHGWLGGDFAAGLRYGVALAALALSQHGDMVVTTRRELEGLVAEGGPRGGNKVAR
ncbi:MAG: sugar kinase [Chloroflexi bacterium]|nr:sugar kinase [Chloroflexota bacterium]MCI0576160.1 sugar kinase [Chloroflexota bacterium]MCI0645429.1 sugar kinase [Chloroflexota bacterium]MCI0731295.1 sugar kinase [Chloroflexota bacterium]